MNITQQTIIDAARNAVRATVPNQTRSLTGSEFKAAMAHAVSALGQEKGAKVDGLQEAIRAEEKALCSARNKSLLSGMVEGWASNPRLRLTANGSSVRVSVPYSRAGTDAETIAAAKLVIAKPAPALDASEGTKAQHAARLRHATATLCRLDADFALEDAKLRILAAQAYAAKLEQAKLDRAAAAAAAGQPPTPEQVAKAEAAATAAAADAKAQAKAQAKADANKRKRDVRAAKRHAGVV